MAGQQKPSGTADNAAVGSRGSASPDNEKPTSSPAAAAAAAAPPARLKAPTRPRRRAVLVGINDYPDVGNDLPSCIADVDAFSAVLKADYGFDDVVRLVDGEATVANVKAALERLFSGATPTDRLVFFYSGHGTTEMRNGVAEECIVLHDGLLFDDVLSQMSQGLPMGIFTLVMDACFSGGLDKEFAPPLFRSFSDAEPARKKVYLKPNSRELVEGLAVQKRSALVKRFGETTVLRPFPGIGDPFDPAARLKALISAPASDETGQVQVRGVLLSACLETETAAASTSATDGKSAFTFALLHSLKKLGVETSIGALVEATQSMLRSMRFVQTPLLKAPPVPPDARSLSFITMDDRKGADGSGDANDIASALLNLLNRSATGERTMDASALIQLLLSAATKDYQPGGQKFPGLEVLLPLIVSAATKGNQPDVAEKISIGDVVRLAGALIKSQQPDSADKSLLGDVIRIAGGLIKSPQADVAEKFSIGDAIRIAGALIKSQQPDSADKSLLGDVIRIAGGLIKGQQPDVVEKLSIGDVVRLAGTLIKSQQPDSVDKSLLGDVIRIAGGLVKGEQPADKLVDLERAIMRCFPTETRGGMFKGQQPAEKLFGIDDAILIPAIVSVVTAAIKGQQTNGADKSLLGDVIRIAGGLIKGEQPADKMVVDNTMLMPVLDWVVRSAATRH